MYSTAGGIGVPPYLASLDTIPAHKFPVPLFHVPSCFPDKVPPCFTPARSSSISVTTDSSGSEIFYQQDDGINPYFIF
jgi:hypothetical protein